MTHRYVGLLAAAAVGMALPLAADAQRFEIHGMPKFLGTAGLAESLSYVNGLDAKAATEHIMSLGDFLIEELKRRDIGVWTQDAHELRSGIIMCEPFPEAERVHLGIWSSLKVPLALVSGPIANPA